MTYTATNQQRASGGFSFTSVSLVPVFVVLLVLRGVFVLITPLPQMARNMYKLVSMWWKPEPEPFFQETSTLVWFQNIFTTPATQNEIKNRFLENRILWNSTVERFQAPLIQKQSVKRWQVFFHVVKETHTWELASCVMDTAPVPDETIQDGKTTSDGSWTGRQWALRPRPHRYLSQWWLTARPGREPVWRWSLPGGSRLSSPLCWSERVRRGRRGRC